MCLSGTVLIVYTLLLIAGAALTIVSLVTPEWRSITERNLTELNFSAVADLTDKENLLDVVANGAEPNKKIAKIQNTFNMGLLGQCGDHNIGPKCLDWFKEIEMWHKIVVAAMFIAIICIGVALVWSLLICCACATCKGSLTPPLPIISGCAVISLLLGIGLYYFNSNIDLSKPPKGYEDLQLTSKVGYSIWTGIGAIIVMTANTVVGIILVQISKIPCV